MYTSVIFPAWILRFNLVQGYHQTIKESKMEIELQQETWKLEEKDRLNQQLVT